MFFFITVLNPYYGFWMDSLLLQKKRGRKLLKGSQPRKPRTTTKTKSRLPWQAFKLEREKKLRRVCKKRNKKNELYSQRKPPKKKGDKRGKHTNESRRLEKEENDRFFNSLAVVNLCDNCSGIDFVPTVDGDAMACTSCGYVSKSRIIEGCTDIALDFHGSAPYRHRNYFAERLLQASGREPSFTSSEENKINVVWSLLHGEDRVLWGNDPRTFSKYRFKQILWVLDYLEPGKRWKQKLEKWWQAREIIYGRDPSWNTLDEHHCYKLKVLFDPIASCFDQYFRSRKPREHNIPKLNIIILILLYNISEESLVKYGWFFLSKNIVQPTKSVLNDFNRIKIVIDKVNSDFINSIIRRDVRRESYQWLQKNKYIVPDLEYLVSLASDSKEGHVCCLQFKSHGSLLSDRTIVIHDDVELEDSHIDEIRQNVNGS